MHVSQLFIYPIKSTAGISLTQTIVDQYGLQHDRRFVLTDLNGNFITARTQHKLCLVRTKLKTQGLVVSAPDMPALTLTINEFSPYYQQVTVWDSKIEGQHCSLQADSWFSQYLGQSCQLLYFGEQSFRQVKRRNEQLAFADGYPLLLTSQAALATLNSRASETISMSQFRPNIVVENTEPFAEDSWQKIQIGEVIFDVVKACVRCNFTTINPVTAEPSSRKEPLATLANFRARANGDICFGQNIVPLNQGRIKQGDKVQVLATKTPELFVDLGANKHTVTQSNATKQVKQPTEKKQLKLTINKANTSKTVSINNQQSILEQAEKAGEILPFSCRAGICGRCKVKLIKGDIEQGENKALTSQDKNNNVILTCCGVAQSDIEITL